MARNILSISWINGQFRALHCRAQDVEGTWVSPSLVESMEDLRTALKTAVHQTQFSGREVMLVVENRNLLYHLQEAPHGRRSTVRSYLERRVTQSRFYEEESAAWGMSQPIILKSGQRFLLTLFPHRWVVGVRDLCAEQGLRVVGIFAAAAVLGHYLQSLPIENDRPVIVATDVGGTLCLVVGRRDGEVLFARTVSLTTVTQTPEAPKPGQPLKVVRTGAREMDRLEQELNRTRLFSQQQFETTITRLWVLGESARRSFNEVRLPDGLTLEWSLVADESNFLAREAAQLHARTSGNLLSQITGELQRRRRNTAAVAAALLAATLGCAAWVNHRIQVRNLELQTLVTQAIDTSEENRQAVNLRELTLRRQLLVASVGSPNDPPVPSLFLRYLGTRLPDRFALSRFEITRNSNRWNIRLEGRQRESDEASLAAVESLERELASSPFKVRITASTRTRLFQEASPETRRVASVTSVSEGERPFFVEGVIE